MDIPLYSVSPQVIRAGQVSEITFKGMLPQSDLRMLDAASLRMETVGADGLFSDGRLPGYTCGNHYDLKRPSFETLPDLRMDAETGELHLTHHFAHEGEYRLKLMVGDDVLTTFHVYAVRPEWIALRPFRGDMHLHSGYSMCCGDKLRISPEYFAAACCARGLDFIGVADHKQYQASLRAADFTEQCSSMFRAYPCEEVHLPDLHNLHMLNFGGRTGVSKTLHEPDDQYRKEIAECLKNTPADADCWVRHLQAHHQWVHQRITELGGLSVLCHPYWRPNDRVFLPTAALDYAMEHGYYDALEVYGDPGDREGNDMAENLHREYCIRQGRHIPLVGNTDSHSLQNLGICTSVVFAEKNECSAIVEAVRANRSVAVSSYPGEFPRCCGDLALVKYYHFLRHFYYPAHDEFAAQEGKLLFAALTTGKMDKAYAEYITKPYSEHKDADTIPECNIFIPDKAAFAAVRRERETFEKAFFQ